jgi:glucose-1-phosphate adenylyltransferase
VGTIDTYYEANMDLLAPLPPMNLYQPDWPIRTYNGQHPPARVAQGSSGIHGQLINSLLSSGTVISGATVRNSILFSRVFVQEQAQIDDSILFDNVEVGFGAQLKRCIVDKAVFVPPGERIGYDRAADAERFTVSDSGITVIPKGYHFDTPYPC